MFKLFTIILRRDLMLAFRRKSDLAQVIFFFAVVVTLVPLGVGAETNILRAIAPGVVWLLRFWLPYFLCRVCLKQITLTGRLNRC